MNERNFYSAALMAAEGISAPVRLFFRTENLPEEHVETATRELINVIARDRRNIPKGRMAAAKWLSTAITA